MFIHERDNDFTFNSAETKTNQFVVEFNDLENNNKKYEYFYLALYVIGSVLIVTQKIMDNIQREEENISKNKVHKKIKS